jgi:hypothetical protein
LTGQITDASINTLSIYGQDCYKKMEIIDKLASGKMNSAIDAATKTQVKSVIGKPFIDITKCTYGSSVLHLNYQDSSKNYMKGNLNLKGLKEMLKIFMK